MRAFSSQWCSKIAPRAPPLPSAGDMLLRVPGRRRSYAAMLGHMNLPRYRHQALGDLMHVVLDPLMRDRVGQAHVRNDNHPEGDEQTVAGIAGDTVFRVPGQQRSQSPVQFEGQKGLGVK